MPTPSQDEKRALRQTVRERLRGLPTTEQAAASAAARELLLKQPLWREARSLLFYAPLAGELDVWPLLEPALAAGRLVALPRFDPQTGAYLPCQVRSLSGDLVLGQFGIREPAQGCPSVTIRLDLILVPGVAFDLHGRRLGRGKGFYDRFLAEVRGTTCGVAFDEQIVPRVPVEPHDTVVNCILTPSRWLEVRAGAVLE
jgi:5-formyltetrahydrofolate cyclo-ligase